MASRADDGREEGEILYPMPTIESLLERRESLLLLLEEVLEEESLEPEEERINGWTIRWEETEARLDEWDMCEAEGREECGRGMGDKQRERHAAVLDEGDGGKTTPDVCMCSLRFIGHFKLIGAPLNSPHHSFSPIGSLGQRAARIEFSGDPLIQRLSECGRDECGAFLRFPLHARQRSFLHMQKWASTRSTDG